MRCASFLLLLACSGCTVIEQPSSLIPRWTTSYRQIIREDDQARLRDWRKTFMSALASARSAGHSAEIAREGRLLDPDAALTQPTIPDGLYRCRVIKIGAKEAGNLDFVTYPGFTCRVSAEHALHRLAKLDGSQRYVGLLFAGDAFRDIFLGTLVLGDQTRAMQYGQDTARDVAGHLERIGPQRWRLVMPQPHFESQIDVMELIPAGATP